MLTGNVIGKVSLAIRVYFGARPLLIILRLGGDALVENNWLELLVHPLNEAIGKVLCCLGSLVIQDWVLCSVVGRL